MILGYTAGLLSNSGETLEIDCALGATISIKVDGSNSPNANIILEAQDEFGEWSTTTGWVRSSTSPSIIQSTTVTANTHDIVSPVQGIRRFRIRATSVTTPANLSLTLDDDPISVPPMLGATQNVNAVASATGGASQSSTLCASGTNITSVKASSGSLYGYEISNNGTAAYWVLFYNAAITLGTTVPVKRIFVPIGATIAMGTMVGESMAQIRFAVCTVANPTAGDAGVAVGDANRIAVNVRFV